MFYVFHPDIIVRLMQETNLDSMCGSLPIEYSMIDLLTEPTPDVFGLFNDVGSNM